MAFQKGDKVRLIDKFYDHPDFKAMPRSERKRLASLRGRVCTYPSRGWCPASMFELVPAVPTERLVKRHALPGERIRIVAAEATFGAYNNGDALTVTRRSPSGGAVYVKEHIRIVWDSEYLVIEPATPALHTYTPDQKQEALRIMSTIYGEVCAEGLSPTTTNVLINGKEGIARCSPYDEYSPEIGLMVALCRATGRALPDWIK